MNKIKICFLITLTAVLFSACGGSSEDEMIIDGASSENSEVSELSGTVDFDSSSEASAEGSLPSTVYVYVVGAVEKPGVYEVTEGTRTFKVIDLAGGFTADAAMDSLNLASVVQDGSVIRVMTNEEVLAGSPETPSSFAGNTGSSSGSGLININTASLTDLTNITGIGESRARAIISYREENGAFSSIEDIKKVSGIKDGLFNKIKDQITV